MKTIATLFLALTTLVSSKLQAQEIWEYRDSLFTYKLQVEEIAHLDSSGYEELVRRIDIYNTEGLLLQSIKIDTTASIPTTTDRSMIFIIEDVNFDGHKDIRLLNWISVSAYTGYRFWFYNPLARKYIEDQTLSEIMSPSFNAQKKLVCSSFRNGGSEYGFRKYVWNTNKNELILIEERSYSSGRSRKKNAAYIYHFWLENGEEKQSFTKTEDGNTCPCICE